VKTLKVPCETRGERGTFQVHVGRPAPGFHPLKYQAAWLWEIRQGMVDAGIMKVLEEPEEIGGPHFFSKK
jgi:Domain of unknown function (DUF2610)